MQAGEYRMSETTPATSEEEQSSIQAEAEIAEQKQVRLAKRARLIDEAKQAYPVTPPITHTIAQVRQAPEGLEPDARTGQVVALAGRIVHLRNTEKLCFAALQSGDGTRIQAMVSLAE